VHDVRTSINSTPPIIYAALKDQLDASFHPLLGSDELYFSYKEEYRAGSLDFVVYNQNRTVVNNALVENIDLLSVNTKRYGTNRYKLTLPTIATGQFYFLEVTNEKGEKKYLKFSKI
ncbi:MAG: hypothetical protein ACRBFS_17465, partial [Aureispira sp.]